MKRSQLIGTVAIIAGAIGVAGWLVHSRQARPAVTVESAKPDAALIAQGEYLARMGDCVSCHTGIGGTPYAGGFALATPFGTFYPPNLTPDDQTGLGLWSADDLWTAMHDGKSRTGEPLYPAFPYDSYTRVSRADSDAIFAYLKSLPPVRAPARAHDLKFPFNQRELVAGWRALYFAPEDFRTDPAHDAQWNRGAYLVGGLAHCGDCHTERNLLGAVETGSPTGGGVLPTSNWYAPPLTSNPETGLGAWGVEELSALLKSGVCMRAAVYGPMAEVVRNSLQYASDADLRAIAIYLKSEGGGFAPKREDLLPTGEIKVLMESGAKIYDAKCKACHLASGEGQPPAYPPLKGNGSVTTRTAINPIRLVLHGGFPPSTRANPRPYGMPPFGQLLDEREIAAVVTYVRRSWGNQASAVAPGEVERARSSTEP